MRSSPASRRLVWMFPATSRAPRKRSRRIRRTACTAARRDRQMLALKLWVRRVMGGAVKAGLAVMPRRLRAVVAEEAPLVARLHYAKREILLRVNSEFEYRIRLHSCS